MIAKKRQFRFKSKINVQCIYKKIAVINTTGMNLKTISYSFHFYKECQLVFEIIRSGKYTLFVYFRNLDIV